MAGTLMQTVALLDQRSLQSLSTLSLMACLHLIAMSSLEAINMAFLGLCKVLNHVMFTFCY